LIELIGLIEFIELIVPIIDAGKLGYWEAEIRRRGEGGGINEPLAPATGSPMSKLEKNQGFKMKFDLGMRFSIHLLAALCFFADT